MAYTPPTVGAANWNVPLNAALASIDATAEEAQDDVDDALAGGGAVVATQEDTASTTYVDLATVGPSVSVTLTEARQVIVLVKAQVLQVSTTDDVYMSFAASGATTVAASDASAVRHNGSGTAEAYASFGVVNCPIGTTTFTAKYRADGGSGRFANRSIAALVT